jgi:hypothetical protein
LCELVRRDSLSAGGGGTCAAGVGPALAARLLVDRLGASVCRTPLRKRVTPHNTLTAAAMVSATSTLHNSQCQRERVIGVVTGHHRIHGWYICLNRLRRRVRQHAARDRPLTAADVGGAGDALPLPSVSARLLRGALLGCAGGGTGLCGTRVSDGGDRAEPSLAAAADVAAVPLPLLLTPEPLEAVVKEVAGAAVTLTGPLALRTADCG